MNEQDSKYKLEINDFTDELSDEVLDRGEVSFSGGYFTHQACGD